MKTSFIVARKKHFFSLFSKLWILFIILMVVFIMVFDGYVTLESASFREGIINLNADRKMLESKIDEDDEAIGLILRQKALAEEIFSNNTLLKESLKNLFDLVPDQITLQKVQMERNALIIYGITPTQDTFNFLLAAPLKSIFHTSQTTFYLTSKGWYNFVSINRIISGDDIRE